jgi:hypothetical protein
MKDKRRGGLPAALIILVALILGSANVIVFARATHGVVSLETVQASAYQCAGCVAFLGGVPVLIGFAFAVWVARTLRRPARAPAIAAGPAESAGPALRLLALLQQEGRLVDFLEEDIGPYEDAQVGAAVRSIHDGCRKVLRERIQLQRIVDQEDGAVVEVPRGFDPASIRVTGNVAGSPPFRGKLQHAGWRAVEASIPDATTDPLIIAPAEVEVP